MKKILLFLLLSMPLLGVAQESFMRGDILVNGGFGLIPYRKHTFPNSDQALKSLPLVASVEYGFSKCFSAGIWGGYYSRTFRYLDSIPGETAGSRVFKSRYIPFGIKGTAHLTKLLERKTGVDLLSEDLDIYASLLLGYEYNFVQHAEGLPQMKSKSKPAVGFVVGARYYFHYRYALFAEMGPGVMGWGALGLTARF